MVDARLHPARKDYQVLMSNQETQERRIVQEMRCILKRTIVRTQLPGCNCGSWAKD